MPHPPIHGAAPAALTVALLALAACGTAPGTDADDPGGTTTDLARTDPRTDPVDELGQDPRPCPARLPGTGDDAFGGSDAASSAPDLPAPDRAWVCTYTLRSAPAAGSRGPAWSRDGAAREVAADRLPDLTTALAALEPAEPGRLCTEELGPRYLVVLATDDDTTTDLTGVAVDAFGCRDVRLTDDPSSTVPGESSAPGVVPGVLAAPDDLVRLLTRDRGR